MTKEGSMTLVRQARGDGQGYVVVSCIALACCVLEKMDLTSSLVAFSHSREEGQARSTACDERERQRGKKALSVYEERVGKA